MYIYKKYSLITETNYWLNFSVINLKLAAYKISFLFQSCKYKYWIVKYMPLPIGINLTNWYKYQRHTSMVIRHIDPDGGDRGDLQNVGFYNSDVSGTDNTTNSLRY
jgi:hypothetical protein